MEEISWCASTICTTSSSASTIYRFNQHCFGQSSGALHYALPEEDARTIHVWSLDADEPYVWSLKYRLNMSHAFGRDNLCQYDADSWKCDYDVITLDIEGDGLLLFDKRERPGLQLLSLCGILLEAPGFNHVVGTFFVWLLSVVPFYALKGRKMQRQLLLN